MQRKTTILNQRELFRDPSAWSELQSCESNFEMYWELLDEFGKGFMYLAKFRPGLALGMVNYYLRENISTFLEYKDSFFVIDFTISGSIECTFDYQDGSRNAYAFNPGQSCITWRPEYQCRTSFTGEVPIRAMGIYIEPSLLKNLIGEQHDYVPAGMRNILDGSNEKYYYHSLTTTIATKIIVQEILNCPYQGDLKRLWLEGKTLELIAHSLTQLGINKEQHNRVCALRPGDVECILSAKDILIHDIENPPSLFELAHIVGISKTKLTRGFREVFGTSVFDYLRTCRLEQGRELLKSGKKNVTEVALEVGYSQPSNFTKAFKRHFATNPINYLR